jgi:NADH:ubiquinone oxidoreductase subunit F (NADH-binding)
MPSSARTQQRHFDSMRQLGSGLGAARFAVFDDSACMVQAAYRYSRFLLPKEKPGFWTRRRAFGQVRHG